MNQQSKKCSRCKETKLATDFKNKSDTKDGKQPWCWDCCKEWKRENRKQIRVYRYDITSEEFAVLVKKQDYKCAICYTDFKVEDDGYVICSIDHDHATDLVRGLLCSHCNLGLGHFQDNSEIAHRASQFLAGDNYTSWLLERRSQKTYSDTNTPSQTTKHGEKRQETSSEMSQQTLWQRETETS